ncbi:MAG TPA: AI-2E family transporter [Acidimicrobiales bacterium]|nr:AI-2E family transporter [Acidimicrobiales bacterium]
MADPAPPALRRDDAMPPWIPRAILWFFGTGLAIVVAWWLVVRLRGLLVMLLVALFLSFALEPAVNWMAERGWRRGAATLTVMFVLLIAGAIFVWAMGAVLVNQVTDFVDEAPRYIEDAEDWFNDTFDADVDFEDLIAEFQEGGSAQEFAAKLGGNIVSAGATVVAVLFQMLTIALFTFYLVADGPRLRRAILSVLPPDRQVEVLRVWEIAIDKTGGYIYSRGILAFFSTLVHWIAFAVIGIPFPLPLAIWVGLISQFVPTIGTYIAGALPIVIALIDKPIDALWVLAVILVYQQIENYLLAPPIQAETMDIHPAVAFGGVIAGASILGPIGALLALPAAATLQAFVSTYVRRHEVIETPLTARPRARVDFLRPLRYLRRTKPESVASGDADADGDGTTSESIR